MNKDQKLQAKNLFVERYKQTPEEKGYPVIEYSEELGSFVYAKSEPAMKAYKKYRKAEECFLPYMYFVMGSGISLFIWGIFSGATAELCQSVFECWSFGVIVVSVIYLIAILVTGWPIRKSEVILIHVKKSLHK